jgi:transcriptional regulator CtsR
MARTGQSTGQTLDSDLIKGDFRLSVLTERAATLADACRTRRVLVATQEAAEYVRRRVSAGLGPHLLDDHLLMAVASAR